MSYYDRYLDPPESRCDSCHRITGEDLEAYEYDDELCQECGEERYGTS